VTPARSTGLAAAAVAVCPVVYVDVDTDAKAERELHRDLLRKLDQRLEEKFKIATDEKYFRHVETHRKKMALSLKMFQRSVAANGGKVPEKVETWGGGADAPLLASLPPTGLTHVERSAVAQATQKNRAFDSETERHAKEQIKAYLEMHSRVERADADLRKALAPKK
jgi:hypothetical protein